MGSNVTIKQDNTSAIQLERNGWKSSSKRTKHIAVRCFHTTEQLQAGDFSRVIYKPTKEMEGNYLTKALQRKLFHTHHKALTGLKGIDEYMFNKKYKNQSVLDCKYYITHV